jgi:hypothetical protein
MCQVNLKGKCGVIECWPLVAKITVKEMVTWSDFEQPHRGPESAGGGLLELQSISPFFI